MLQFFASVLPRPLRRSVRTAYHHRQIRRGAFRSPEPDWDRLAEWIAAGDTVIDVGANVGHYACRMSELVGSRGRVLAFEPVPETFAALAANARRFAHSNVTLFNAAVGAETGFVGFDVPDRPDGSYLARVQPEAALRAMVLPIDALQLPGRVAFIKIDAEGYEPHVLAGMAKLIRRDRPIVMLEKNGEAQQLLERWGYAIEAPAKRSPNAIAKPQPFAYTD